MLFSRQREFLRAGFEKLGMTTCCEKSKYFGPFAPEDAIKNAGLSAAGLSFKLLGGYIGDPEDCHRRLLEDFAKYDYLFEQLILLPKHVAFSLLRTCGPVCAVYAARIHPPQVSIGALQRFEAGILQCLRSLLHVQDVEAVSRAQIHLPVADGGFGLLHLVRSAEFLHKASLMDVGTAAAGNQQMLMKQLDIGIKQDLYNISPATAARLRSCSGRLCWLTSHKYTLADWEWCLRQG